MGDALDSGSVVTELVKAPMALEALRQLLASDDTDLDALFQHYLSTATELYGLRLAIIAFLDGDNVVIRAVRSEISSPFHPGDVFALAKMPASEVVQRRQGRACHDVSLDPSLRALELHQTFPFECYIAAPIRVSGAIIGTFSMMDEQARSAPFPSQALPFLELLAETLGRTIERNRLETLRHEAEQARNEAMLLFSTAFAAAPIAMALVSIDGRFLRVNPAACRLFGYDEPDLLQLNFQSLTHPDDLGNDLKHLSDLRTGVSDSFQIEKRYLRPGGAAIWALLSVAVVRNADGSPRYYVSQIQDIDRQKSMIAELSVGKLELEKANATLTQLASRDPLTGFLNRRALRERLSEEMATARQTGAPLAFVMFDLDYFKDYNDRHGHLEGDIALREVAYCLRDAARASDILGRFGGEEFLLLLPRTTQAEANEVAERARERIAALRLRNPLTVSAGVHVFKPGSGVDPLEQNPIAQADMALYRAKHNGRNRVEAI